MSKQVKQVGLTVLILGLLSLACGASETHSGYSHAESHAKISQVFGPPVTWGPPLGPIVVPGPGVTYYTSPFYVGNYPPVVVQGPVIVRTPWRPFLRTFIP